ncbi:Hpt domain-containing protein [Vibrio sp. SCSIO 43135]|uniref:Hpt domain-containing protein n=1 Tax=Vibrio sp. SCSIO 43135 TaxID=2819096 RepID=UPI0020752C77|nr:Hpt domain-containing protein [Vibrio sp. SCSIO 43135]USD40040.1 Hpt domain-containing protein [Vibrio sp. SCSIO 43135]
MIDFAPFFNDLDNDPESIQLILMAYIEEYGDSEEKLMLLYEKQDWGALYIFAHSLKGILVGFGETEVTTILEDIESETHDNTPASEHKVLAACSLLPNVRSQIETELANVS